MIYTLPKLPYSYGDLEPYIDTLTMEIHHTKHHQAYIDKLNEALAKYPILKQQSLRELLVNVEKLPEDVRTTIRNNGGGTFNHSMFWLLMSPNGGKEPKGRVGKEIKNVFGSFEIFKDQFSKVAKDQFGSGWAWLSVDKQGKLIITGTNNQDTPLSYGQLPILCLDVWEHAYYLKYQNKRPDYITAWWQVVNWEEVEHNYERLF